MHCAYLLTLSGISSGFEPSGLRRNLKLALAWKGKAMKLESSAFGLAFRGITNPIGEGTGVEW